MKQLIKTEKLLLTHFAPINENRKEISEKISNALLSAAKRAVKKVFLEEDPQIFVATRPRKRGVFFEVYLTTDIYSRHIGKLIREQSDKELIKLGNKIQSIYLETIKDDNNTQ